MSEEYAAKTIRELKELARNRGVVNWSTRNKADLVTELEKLDAKGDPMNFADMPDEIVPAPDEEKPVEVKAEKPAPAPAPKTEPVAEGPAPDPIAFKLMNDLRYMKRDGTVAILKAGRVLKSTEYDIDRVKASGGVLTPLVK